MTFMKNIMTVSSNVRSYLCVRNFKFNVHKNKCIYINRRFFVLKSNHDVVEALKLKTRTILPLRLCSGNQQDSRSNIDIETYHNVSEETLESLRVQFEDLVEDKMKDPEADVMFGNGVLTVNLGSKIGTYVINKQSPNKQIWLSSPISGPKRYDFVSNQWIYHRDGVSLHKLLSDEVSTALNIPVNFSGSILGETP